MSLTSLLFRVVVLAIPAAAILWVQNNGGSLRRAVCTSSPTDL
jgi:hypothetical protein